MSTDLRWIGEKARKEPGLVFTSLYHHVTDLDNLRDCYEALDDKAVGVDGVTKEQYGEKLEENLLWSRSTRRFLRTVAVGIGPGVASTCVWTSSDEPSSRSESVVGLNLIFEDFSMRFRTDG